MNIENQSVFSLLHVNNKKEGKSRLLIANENTNNMSPFGFENSFKMAEFNPKTYLEAMMRYS